MRDKQGKNEAIKKLANRKNLQKIMVPARAKER